MKSVAIAVFMLAGATAVSQAETTLCTNITSLPATISAPGSYCLKQDLATSMTSGFAITIDANSVVLDLNGFRLAGASAGPSTTAIGIATFRDNVTVRNGSVRGFSTNIQFAGSNNVIENMKIDTARSFGIRALGIGHIVRNNDVTRTTGTAIQVGLGPVVVDSNTISQVNGTVAIGIHMMNAHNSVVQNNTITQLDGSTSERGIKSDTSNTVVVRNNMIQTSNSSTAGIDLTGGTGDGCFDNIISANFVTLSTGCEIEDNNRKF